MPKWFNLTLRGDVIEYMSLSTSESDWQGRARNVRYANKGVFPTWWGALIDTGLAVKIARERAARKMEGSKHAPHLN